MEVVDKFPLFQLNFNPSKPGNNNILDLILASHLGFIDNITVLTPNTGTLVTDD